MRATDRTTPPGIRRARSGSARSTGGNGVGWPQAHQGNPLPSPVSASSWSAVPLASHPPYCSSAADEGQDTYRRQHAEDHRDVREVRRDKPRPHQDDCGDRSCKDCSKGHSEGEPGEHSQADGSNERLHGRDETRGEMTERALQVVGLPFRDEDGKPIR